MEGSAGPPVSASRKCLGEQVTCEGLVLAVVESRAGPDKWVTLIDLYPYKLREQMLLSRKGENICRSG